MFNYLKLLSSFAAKRNGVIKFWLGPFPVIVVTDPEDAETVLNSCLSKGLVYRFSKPWVGQGLVTSRASVWKRHIKKLSPAFNQKVLDRFLEIFNVQASILVQKISNKVGEEFDMYPYIGAANLETICQTAMGTPMNLQDSPNHPYLEAIESILQIITKRSSSIWLQMNRLFNLTKYKYQQDEAIEVLHGVSNAVIKKKKAEIGDHNKNDSPENNKKAFLDLILDLNSQEQVFTNQEIREQVDTLIAAGHETSSHVLLYTLLMIGSHGDVQERVYKEISEVMGQEKSLEKEDLNKLVYLEAVIKESMRLYPVVPMVFRYIDKDLKLKNFTIPKGCNSGISIWGLNRHETWGKDFDSFRPERWMENNGNQRRHPANFATFSYGRRVCIGKTYAMMSLKTTMCHLVRKYIFVADISQMKLNVQFILKPVAGHFVKIKLR